MGSSLGSETAGFFQHLEYLEHCYGDLLLLATSCLRREGVAGMPGQRMWKGLGAGGTKCSWGSDSARTSELIATVMAKL